MIFTIINAIFKQLRREPWKSQNFNGVWTCDIATPVRRSKQLSYEATYVESWSFVSSNEPVRNECEVLYEMFHTLNCGFEIKLAMIFAVMNAVFKQLRIEAWKSQDMNGVWTRERAIPEVGNWEQV